MTTVPDKSLRRFPFFPGLYGGEPRAICPSAG